MSSLYAVAEVEVARLALALVPGEELDVEADGVRRIAERLRPSAAFTLWSNDLPD